MAKPKKSKPTSKTSRRSTRKSSTAKPAKSKTLSSEGVPDKKLFRICMVLAVVIAIADQLTKWAALEGLSPHVPVSVTPFFNLTLAFNSGAAFSFLSDAGGWQRWLFIGLAGVISIFLIYWVRQLQKHEFWTGIALGLILGGALGNVWDRLFRSGQVVDFIDIYIGNAHWPAFNLADSSIFIGAAIVVIQAIHEAATGRDSD